MCSTGISFGRSKLLQSCGNFTLKPELEITVIACLPGRDAQEVLYTGFVQTPNGDSKRLGFLPDICNADFHKTTFSSETYTVLNVLLNGLKRESSRFGKNYPLSFLTIVYFLLLLFAPQARDCSVLCDHCAWWGRDEVRPKVKCIHPKLIIVCRRLQAVKKQRETARSLCLSCLLRSKNSKNIFFGLIMISLEKSVSTWQFPVNKVI